MSRIGDLYIEIEEKAWDAISRNPSVGFDELVKEVSLSVSVEGYNGEMVTFDEDFLRPAVEPAYLEYKRTIAEEE